MSGEVPATAYRLTTVRHRLSTGGSDAQASINDSDIASNLIKIRHYLDKRVRATAQDFDGSAAEPPAFEIYRYAEYADGRRPRFAKTDLILVGIVLGFGALIAAFIIY